MQITCLSAAAPVVTSGLDRKKKKEKKIVRKHQQQIYLVPPSSSFTLHHRHVYDNVVKGEHHIYENVGELRDATPDLILAVKPKAPEDKQVRQTDVETLVVFSTALRPSSLTLSFLSILSSWRPTSAMTKLQPATRPHAWTEPRGTRGPSASTTPSPRVRSPASLWLYDLKWEAKSTQR